MSRAIDKIIGFTATHRQSWLAEQLRSEVTKLRLDRPRPRGYKLERLEISLPNAYDRLRQIHQARSDGGAWRLQSQLAGPGGRVR